MKSSDLRSGFLKFFEGHGHAIKPSASLIPDDPSLLFTVAGMVPFKPLFLGQVKLDLARATSSQKCIRTNDIDNVGRTRRHHTFFEMLGNFSFGDYFKHEAIGFAWEFLTDKKWMGLDKEKLWISVFEDDDDAEKIWLAHVPKSRILRMGAKDNFWAAGPTGPCGPCSEIYYDFGPAADPKVKEGDVENGGDRYIEIWNNVFMQFDRDDTGKMTPLPRKNIDTGMGLERLSAVMQGKLSNFETDLFKPIIDAAAEQASLTYGADPQKDWSLKVISDHLRGGAFLIGDGVMPGNEGRGYVLRRILRRAVRHGRILGIRKTFLHELFPAVQGIFGSTYPELNRRQADILGALKDEEERFSRTLDTGTEMLEGLMKKASSKTLDGAEIFKLYDTFGFPLELTQEMAAEKGFTVDEPGFKAQMEAQRQRARAARADGGHGDSPVYGKVSTRCGKTVFRGYETVKVDAAKVVALVKDGAEVQELVPGEEGEAFLDATPFYGESGGQVGDQGLLIGAGLHVVVDETRKRAGGELHSHLVRVSEGTLKVGGTVSAQVDAEARAHTGRHHSATHVLHAALRKALGDHVHQAGSYCGPDRLRFDFHHNKALSPEERRSVEDQVNAWILSNALGQTRVLGIEEAKKEGAMALFGEKYGDSVRVVSFGDWSKELCGGTHIKATGEIGIFRILSESSVSSGVRRIEGVAGAPALQVWRDEQAFVDGVASSLKSTVADLPVRVAKLLEREKELQKKLEKAMAGGGGGLDEILKNAQDVAGVKLAVGELPDTDEAGLKAAGDTLKQKLGSGVIVLASRDSEKATLVVMVTPDLVKRVAAGKLVAALAPKVDGRGGGRPEMAQAGGKNPAGLDAALAAAPAELKALLG